MDRDVARKHPIPPNPLTDHVHELLPFYIAVKVAPVVVGSRLSSAQVVVGPRCSGAQVVLGPSVRAAQVEVSLRWTCRPGGRVAQVDVPLRMCRFGCRTDSITLLFWSRPRSAGTTTPPAHFSSQLRPRSRTGLRRP